MNEFDICPISSFELIDILEVKSPSETFLMPSNNVGISFNMNLVIKYIRIIKNNKLKVKIIIKRLLNLLRSCSTSSFAIIAPTDQPLDFIGA